jgi:hypothetical protein
MRSSWCLAVGIAAVLAGACQKPSPIAPGESPASLAAAGTAANAGDPCTIEIGETTNRPLPALHFMSAMFGAAATQSELNCGNVRSLDAKLEAIAQALDENPPNFHAGCGTSGALLNELESLLARGDIQNISFPPPAEGAPTTLLGIAEELNGIWCAAARGEITGPGLLP